MLFNKSFPALMLRARNSFNKGYELEMDLLKYFTNPEKDSIDIGANYGIYSYKLSQLSRNVHSFEPVPHLFNNLKKAVKSIANIQIHNCGLSDYEGTGILYSPEYTHGWSSLEKNNGMLQKIPENDKLHEYKISINTLDSYSFANISFIKIDVEGHELNVIKGAVNTIKSSIPVLQIEIEERHKNNSVTDVIKFVKEMDNYFVFYFINNELHPYDSTNFINNHLINSNIYVYNFIFIHKNSSVLDILKSNFIL